MLRLSLVICTPAGTTLAGAAIGAAVIGALAAIPVAWIVAKRLSAT